MRGIEACKSLQEQQLSLGLQNWSRTRKQNALGSTSFAHGWLRMGWWADGTEKFSHLSQSIFCLESWIPACLARFKVLSAPKYIKLWRETNKQQRTEGRRQRGSGKKVRTLHKNVDKIWVKVTTDTVFDAHGAVNLKDFKQFWIKYSIALEGGGISVDIWRPSLSCLGAFILVGVVSDVWPYNLEASEPAQIMKRSPLWQRCH